MSHLPRKVQAIELVFWHQSYYGKLAMSGIWCCNKTLRMQGDTWKNLLEMIWDDFVDDVQYVGLERWVRQDRPDSPAGWRNALTLYK